MDRIAAGVCIAFALALAQTPAHAQTPGAGQPPSLCVPSTAAPLAACQSPTSGSEWAYAVVLWAEDGLARGNASAVREHLRAWMPRLESEGARDSRIRVHGLLGEAAASLGLVKEARVEFQACIQLWLDPSSWLWLQAQAKDARSRSAIGAALDAVGKAVFSLALLARRESDAAVSPTAPSPPKELLNTKEAAHQRVLQTWIEQHFLPWRRTREASLDSLARLFRSVFDIPPAPPVRWSVAASEAIGDLWSQYSDQLRALAVLPGPSVRATPGYYTSTPLAPASELYQIRAKEAYLFCLQTSVNNRFFDAASLRCESWLARHYRGEFSTYPEFRPLPDAIGTWLDDRRVLLRETR